MGRGKGNWLAWERWHGKLPFRREGGVLFVLIEIPEGSLWLAVPAPALPLMGWP